MKRSGIALAVGTLFIAPAALAQTTAGNVVIYGKLYPQLTYSKSSGATAVGSSVSELVSTGDGTNVLASGDGNGFNHKGRYSVDSNNSYVGFRGQEDLGGGLKAIWQIEQSVQLDSGTSGFWATRNSFVGLSSNFGTVKLGFMDTIYKEYGSPFSLFGITSGNFVSSSNVLSTVGFGNDSDARFHTRRANSIQYESPEVADFTVGVQYGVDELKGNPGRTMNADLWSFGVKWESGPFYVSVQHEISNDRFGGSENVGGDLNSRLDAALAANPDARSKDTATRFSVAWNVTNMHRLSADFAMMKYDESGQTPGVVRFKEYKHNAWQIGWESSWGGPWRTALQYVSSGAGSCKLTIGGCSTSGLDGKMIVAGVAYDFSKRTFLYLIGARVINGHSAMFTIASGWDATPGADVTAVALGIQHRF